MDLVKEIRKILAETIAGEHYAERLYDRFLNQTTLTVGYEIPGSVGEYEEVGTYILSPEIKDSMLDNIKEVENYSFPQAKSYGVQLAYILIDKNKVTYFDEDLKNKAKSHTLVFVDRKTESNGNVVYAIIRGNKIITIYFAKSYVTQSPEKLKVDGIIKNIDVLRAKKVR